MCQTATMRFNVAQLLKGPTGACREYDLYSEIHHLDAELEPLGPLEGSVSLMRTIQGILVTGELSTRLRQECRRCLELCEVDAKIRVEEEYHPASRIGGMPIEPLPAEERDEALLIDDRHVLDLSEVVRQELILVTSAQAVCRTDCAGLCSRCGGNLNMGECRCDEVPIDPRWAALQTLLPHQTDTT